MIALIATILIDTAIVKIYDITDKSFIPLQLKIILFSLNSIACLLLQFLIVRQLQRSFRADKSKGRLRTNLMYVISLTALCSLGFLIGFLVFQQFYYHYYSTVIVIYIITISYGTSVAFIVWMSVLFFSWYRTNRSKIILLYFLSMLIISSNLIITAISTDIKVTYRPELTGPYVGGSGDIAGIRSILVDN